MVESRVHHEGTKEFKALQKVVERFEIAKRADEEIKKKHLDYYKLYRNQRERRENRSSIFVPMIYSVVETMTPRILKGLFDKRPYMTVLPRDYRSVPSAEANEKLLDFQFSHRNVNLIPKSEDWVKQFLMYGVGLCKTYWDLTEKTITKRTTVATNAITNEKHIVEDIEDKHLLTQIEGGGEWGFSTEEVEQDVTIYEGPNFNVVDVGEFYVAPNAHNAQESEYVIERYHLDLEVLKEGQKNEEYKNTKKLEEMLQDSAGTLQDETEVDKRKAEMGYSTKEERSDRHRTPIEILEYWENEERILVAEREVVIAGPEENPYWHKNKPYISVHNNRLLGEFWSIGEIEPNVDLQEEINTRRNQRIDNINLSLNKAFFLINNAKLDEGKLQNLAPGDIIRVKNITRIQDAIQELGVSDVTASSFQEEAITKQDMQMTSGIYDWYSGKQPTQQQTATTVTAIIGEAHVRIEMKIMKFAMQGLAELAQHFIQLNQQFIEDTQVLRIVGEEGTPHFQAIQPQEIAGFFDMQPAATGVDPLANKELLQQQAMQLYSMMREDPVINPMAIATLALKHFDLVENPEEYIVEPQMAPPGAEGQPQGPEQPQGQGQ